jgi:hypothetical protein
MTVQRLDSGSLDARISTLVELVRALAKEGFESRRAAMLSSRGCVSANKCYVVDPAGLRRMPLFLREVSGGVT